MGPSCCLNPLYSLDSKFNLTLMGVAAFSLGLGLGPNFKPNVEAMIFLIPFYFYLIIFKNLYFLFSYFYFYIYIFITYLSSYWFNF